MREEDVKFEVNPKELMPYKLVEADFLTGKDSERESCSNKQERVERLRKLIRRDHLNSEEKESVDRLIFMMYSVYLGIHNRARTRFNMNFHRK